MVKIYGWVGGGGCPGHFTVISWDWGYFLFSSPTGPKSQVPVPVTVAWQFVWKSFKLDINARQTCYTFFFRRKSVDLYTRHNADTASWEIFSEPPVRNKLSRTKREKISSTTELRKVTLTLEKLRTKNHKHTCDTAKFKCSCDILGNRAVYCWHIMYVCLQKYV